MEAEKKSKRFSRRYRTFRSAKRSQGKIQGKLVVQVYHNKPQPLVELQVDDGIIRATANHPFYVRKNCWDSGGQAGCRRPIPPPRRSMGAAKAKLVTEIIEPVFNLQVADNHTYFVGTPDGKSIDLGA